MPNPILYVMCGYPGSGKTTFAKKFAEEVGCQYIGTDDFYRMLNGDELLHINKFEVWMTIYRALHIAEQAGRDVILDTNAPTPVERSQLIDWFPDFDHILIYIKADKEQCFKNNASRRRVIPEEEMIRLFDSFQPPTYAEDRRWFDIWPYENVDNNIHEILSHEF